MDHYQDQIEAEHDELERRRLLQKKKERLAAQAEFPEVLKKFKETKRAVNHSLPHFNEKLQSQLETKLDELQSLLEFYQYILNDDGS